MSSIFVQISSLNDEELYKTVENCIAESSGNNVINFGLHECYVKNKTKFNSDNIKISYSKAPENLGIGQGRFIANKFYNKEDYYLQVDAHSRFAKNWDQILIDNLNEQFILGNKCVLTAYPLRYWYENGIEKRDLTTDALNIKFSKDYDYFKETRNLKQEASWDIESGCSNTTSGGFVFGPGKIAYIEHHPGIFFGEEMIRAAALYTNGYNLMIPKTNVIYHLYGTDSNRKAPWELFPDEFNRGMEFSKYVIKTILIENRENNISLGSERSLYQYGNYIGVNFENGNFL